MPSTTNGAPYPATTGPNNVPGDIKALAEWVDADVLQALTAAIAAQATPAGAIMAWDDPAAPAGWHTMDGRAISRADNPKLFLRYGTVHGSGNGATTFNLPNRKGRVLVGLDPDQPEFDSIGETGGAKTHTLSQAEMPVHTHAQNPHNHTQQPHTHPSSNSNGGGAAVVGGNAESLQGGFDRFAATQPNGNLVIGQATATNNQTTATNQNAGGGQAHNNLQPYSVTTWIIKAG